MPWLGISEKKLPDLAKGEIVKISKVELYEVIFNNIGVDDIYNFLILIFLSTLTT